MDVLLFLAAGAAAMLVVRRVDRPHLTPLREQPRGPVPVVLARVGAWLLLAAWLAGSLLPIVAIHAAVTGYWGPEWGDPSNDAIWWTVLWVLAGIAVGLAALRLRRVSR